VGGGGGACGGVSGEGMRRGRVGGGWGRRGAYVFMTMVSYV
jgi:hypothetical protein